MDELLKDETAGDPITGLKWTKKTSHTISRALKRQGYEVGDDTVRRLLKKRRYVLRANRKRLNKRKDSNRDRQMRYLVRTRKQHEKGQCSKPIDEIKVWLWQYEESEAHLNGEAWWHPETNPTPCAQQYEHRYEYDRQSFAFFDSADCHVQRH